jgi:hypothetical protein
VSPGTGAGTDRGANAEFATSDGQIRQSGRSLLLTLYAALRSLNL